MFCCNLGYFYYFCDVEYSVIYKNFNIVMRKLFTLAFVAIMVVATSCELLQKEPQAPAKTEQGITLTSASMIEVPAEGDVYTITYTIEGEEGNVIATTDNPQMIDTINSNGRGIVRINVTANPTTEVREANVVLTFGSSSASVKVVQSASEVPALEVVTIEANQLVGNYYGDDVADGVGHYWIILTKDGFVNGSTVVGGEYFRLDLIAPLTDNRENITLPDGDYRFDPSLAYDEFTIVNLGNTDYTWIDSTGEALGYNLVDASLSVQGSHIELVAMTEDEDKEYRVSFDGSYSLTPPYEITDYV